MLRVVCTVVGALALYCALMAGLWAGVMRVARRRARIKADRRDAAGSPVTSGPSERRAHSWDELPSWLWRDRPWAVAAVLLGAPAVRDRTAPFVDFPHRTIDWAAMLDASQAWPPDQRLMVQTAYELAFGSPSEAARPGSAPVTLQDVIRHFGDDEVERIRLAMQIRRGRLEPTDALTRLT